MLFMQPIIAMGNITNRLQSSLASAERVFILLNEEEEIPEETGQTIEDAEGKVEIEHMSFCYSEDKPLIEDMNIIVEPGQLVAIVGPTGGGKTTLVNLLMRFYDVQAGSIMIDGIDIRRLPRENLRRIFGMVLQDTWLFNGTISDNIRYGKLDATDEEVKNAAKSAQVHHFRFNPDRSQIRSGRRDLQ